MAPPEAAVGPMTAKAIRAKGEARTSRKLQEGRNSRKASLQESEVNGNDKGEGQR